MVLAIFWWISTSHIYNTLPTIHSKCKDTSSCGGDLICDTICHRCKKRIGGNCSSDIDCESGLLCKNWICVSSNNNISNDIALSPKSKHSSKRVHWNDNQNQIHYFES